MEKEIDDEYVEDFYGDYDETFVPPPVPTTPKTSNPFGVLINFDDYKLSDIKAELSIWPKATQSSTCQVPVRDQNQSFASKVSN